MTVFQKISKKIEDLTSTGVRAFLDVFEIFEEDYFLLRSFQKFWPSGFLPFCRFPKFGELSAKILYAATVPLHLEGH